MIDSSQNPHDKVLWVAKHGGKTTRSRLSRQVKTPLARLEPILQELDVIEISDLKHKKPNQLVTPQSAKCCFLTCPQGDGDRRYSEYNKKDCAINSSQAHLQMLF
jgi:hypothetical protein